jgi:hypothetical protein
LEVIDRRMDADDHVLMVRVTAGDFTTEMTTRDNSLTGAWLNCAQKAIVKVDAWAAANHARILARPTQATH